MDSPLAQFFLSYGIAVNASAPSKQQYINFPDYSNAIQMGLYYRLEQRNGSEVSAACEKLHVARIECPIL
jgi:hypothetical protein